MCLFMKHMFVLYSGGLGGVGSIFCEMMGMIS